MLFSGIEASGTQFVYGVGINLQDFKNELKIPSDKTSKTLKDVIQYFQKQSKKYPISSSGKGTFGPLDLSNTSKTFGINTATSKKRWANTDILGIIQKSLGIPIIIDTDVNIAA